VVDYYCKFSPDSDRKQFRKLVNISQKLRHTKIVPIFEGHPVSNGYTYSILHALQLRSFICCSSESLNIEKVYINVRYVVFDDQQQAFAKRDTKKRCTVYGCKYNYFFTNTKPLT